MSSRPARRLATAAALCLSVAAPASLGSSAVAADGASASTSADARATSQRICDHDRSFVKSTRRGAAVWIPTSKHFGSPSNPSGWQQGGTQGYSEADGQQTAKTKGSADTVGGTGGLDFGVGSVSATYNRQWNRSSTTSNSVTRTWSQAVNLPAGKLSRMRIYQTGWRFKYTYVVTYFGGPNCPNRTFTKWAVLPTKKKQTSMQVELYSKRNKVKPR